MCILVELDDTFSEEHSFDEPSKVDFSEITPHIDLSDPISAESFPTLASTSPISSLFSSFPILLPSLGPLILLLKSLRLLFLAVLV